MNDIKIGSFVKWLGDIATFEGVNDKTFKVTAKSGRYLLEIYSKKYGTFIAAPEHLKVL